MGRAIRHGDGGARGGARGGGARGDGDRGEAQGGAGAGRGGARDLVLTSGNVHAVTVSPATSIEKESRATGIPDVSKAKL